MSDFYKTFLRDDIKAGSANSGRWVFLAAFGKHPGWDDHIEDMGMETESLIQAKQRLYLDGIGGQIDSGAWEKLPPAHQLPRFEHIFVWERLGQSLLGRLWASSDGKGRARYPMVVCAHLGGLPLAWAARHVLPRLERVQQACQATRSPNEVQSLIAVALQDLRREIAQFAPDLSQREESPIDREQFLARPEWGPNHQALLRILHQMQQQMAPYFQGDSRGNHDPLMLKPQQIRVPRGTDSAADAIELWSQFFALQLPPDTPVLFVLPLAEKWLDITVGEPTASEFFCLRASLEAIPLASSIPYHIDPEVKQKGEQIMAAMRRGDNPRDALSNPPAPTGITSKLSTLLSKQAHNLMSRVSGRKT